jgi:hypothetical protein
MAAQRGALIKKKLLCPICKASSKEADQKENDHDAR